MPDARIASQEFCWTEWSMVNQRWPSFSNFFLFKINFDFLSQF
jgi:hypothetical protein